MAPSPSTCPSRTMTQPTRGLGAVLYMTERASARARRIQETSSVGVEVFTIEIVCAGRRASGYSSTQRSIMSVSVR
ncbi:Uncharacterised protein [Bordetella pertussis]|nr:Uncharacterised protein [Bordetella pertussis]